MYEKMPLKRINTPTAKHLESLISIHQDLRYVMHITHDSIKRMRNKKSANDHVLQTHWSAALITYARPFMSGSRWKLTSTDIFDNSDGALKSHEYFIKQRSKLIAHSVNPFEQAAVGIFVNSNWKVVGTGEVTMKLTWLPERGFNDLNQLAKRAIEFNKNSIDDYKNKLLKEVSSLSVMKLKKLKNIRLVVPGPDDAGKARA